MKFYITGCARSGTTLLQRLFFAFENVEIIPKEIKVSDFCNHKQKNLILVGKRYANTVFSTDKLSEKEMIKQLDTLSKNRILVINMIRDGRDVVQGGPNKQPRRWIESVKQSEKWCWDISLQLYYEELVSNPEGVQKVILDNFPNLQVKHKFSDYPSFLPDDFPVKNTEKYKPRPISTDRIGKNTVDWRKLCKNKKEEKEFMKLLELCEYEN